MSRRSLRRSALLPLLVLATTGCAGTDAATAPASPPSAGESSSSPSSAPAGQRIGVTVTGGQPSGDTGRIPVPVGEHVTLVVTSDVADAVHVHGYDLEAELAPGTPTELAFDAAVPGVFEVELHEAGTVLLTLQVG